MGVAKVEYYGRTLIDLTGDSVNPDVLGEGETAHDANGDLIVGRGVLNKGNFANAIVGNVLGEVVAMDDISPLEHKVSVKVRNKNLIPFPFSEKTVTRLGITFTVNNDGTLTLNGTATEDTYFILAQASAFLVYLVKGQTYTLNALPISGSYQSIYAYVSEADGTNYFELGNDVTFTVKKSGYAECAISIKKGFVANNLVLKPQLVLGTTATGYVPYIKDDEVITVSSCGKNLFDISKIPNDTQITIENGIMNISGTTNPWTQSTLKDICPNLKVGDTVVLSFTTENADGVFKGSSTYIYLLGAKTVWYNRSSLTITQEMLDGRIALYTSKYPQTHTEAQLYDFQIEFGTTPTEYFSYIEGEKITTTFAKFAKGVEFTSIAPNMTIYTDKTSAIVECSYNKDTNMVIEKLTQAIIALGGNV